jgi:hypothetical protein
MEQLEPPKFTAIFIQKWIHISQEKVIQIHYQIVMLCIMNCAFRMIVGLAF